MNVPTPRIIAWSANLNNPVGAEYILEDKTPGKSLGSVWYQWPMKFKFKNVSQVERARAAACIDEVREIWLHLLQE